MQASSGLLSLFMVVVLTLVAPTGTLGGPDVHRGRALHPVFEHPHPEPVAQADALVSASSVIELHAAVSLPAGGLGSATGEVLPRPAGLPLPTPLQSFVGRLTSDAPSGLISAPPDPPPDLA